MEKNKNKDPKNNTPVERLNYPSDWISRKNQSKKISMLTVYDATIARLLSVSQVDALLVGDSLGMTVQGRENTISVSLKDMIYHAKIVRRGAPNSFIVVDMPLGSYQAGINEAVKNAIRLFQEY